MGFAQVFAQPMRQHCHLRGYLSSSVSVYGAATRDRTEDLSLTRRLLYQLSYNGMISLWIFHGTSRVSNKIHYTHL